MAPREEEIFTDLTGKPDTADTGDKGGADVLETSLLALGKADEIKDEDLEVSTEEEDDEDGAAAAAAATAAEEEEDDEEEEAPNGDPNFDPKDVQLLAKDAELLETREIGLKKAETDATAAIDQAKKDMLEAQEAGESAKNIAATERYTAATIALRDAQDGLKIAVRDKAGLTTRAQELLAKAPKDAEGKPILDGTKAASRVASQRADAEKRGSKLLPKFKAANGWFGNAKFAKQTAALKAIDTGLAAEGRLSKDTPEYFAELGKRMNREYPGIYKNLDGKPVATGQRQRGAGGIIPNGGGGGGGGGGGDQTGKVKLTSADLAQMRQFQMDPDNKDHRRTWLQSKIEIAAKDARGAA